MNEEEEKKTDSNLELEELVLRLQDFKSDLMTLKKALKAKEKEDLLYMYFVLIIGMVVGYISTNIILTILGSTIVLVCHTIYLHNKK